MEGKLSLDDLKRFAEFEEKLLSLKDVGVVYKKDDALEIEIKKEALFSHFGQQRTEELMEKLQLKFEDLVNQGVYIEIYKFLDNN